MDRRVLLLIAGLGACCLSGCASFGGRGSQFAGLGLGQPAAKSQSRWAFLSPPQSQEQRSPTQPIIATSLKPSQRSSIQRAAGEYVGATAPSEHLMMPTPIDVPRGQETRPAQPMTTYGSPMPPMGGHVPPHGGPVLAAPGEMHAESEALPAPPWGGPACSGSLCPIMAVKRLLHLPEIFCAPCGVTAGAGVYYVKPYWEDNVAYTTMLTTPTTFTSRDRDFSYEYETTPRVWLGVNLGNGRGLVGHYWRYNQGVSEHLADPIADASFVIPGPVGITSVDEADLAINNNIKLDVYDLDLSQNFSLGCWNLTGGVGVRYAHLRQSYSLSATAGLVESTLPQSVPTLVTSAGLFAGSTFKGIGPSLTMEARRPLFGCLNLYASARGSLLIGDVDQETSFSGDIGDGVLITRSLGSDNRDVMPIGEIEAGIELARDLGHKRLTIQAGYAGQVWFGAGNAFGGDGDLAFSGFMLTLGLHR